MMGKYLNSAILILEHHVQIIVSYLSNFFAKYIQQKVIIKILIINDEISIM